MSATGNAYVYALSDPTEPDPVRAIFYVGKGTGLRAQQHTADARAALDALLDGADSPEERAALGAKIDRIADIHARGQEPRVDVIAAADGTGIPDTTAFDVEAALIAVLRMTALGNKVKGHRLRLVPESVFARAGAAKDRTLPEGSHAVAVPVTGLWGGRDYAGTLLAADDDDLWENARQLWQAVAAPRAADIARLAATDRPAVLLVLAPHPDPARRNVVVGVFELAAARRTDRPLPGGGPGWEFDRIPPEEERPATTALRERHLGHTLARADGTRVRRTQNRSYPQWP